ncbi:MAG: methionine-gamma-lyase [Planctomycetota bacterium]|jgi:methionine-gamma-lyase
MKKKKINPESLMMSHGYKPELSEGSIKTPIFQTSTFVFKSAEDGKNFFEIAYGLKEQEKGEELGLIYSRLNNPNLEILEGRIALWDDAEMSACFESGMAGITTVFLEILKPGDLLLYSRPVYGGTDFFINKILPKWGIHSIGFKAGSTKEEIKALLDASDHKDKLALVHVETPANPTNALVDIEVMKELADEYSREEEQVLLAVDNTYMGPIWSDPLQLGADLVMYSATKYINGHSDVVAGAVSGNTELMTRVKGMRTFLGNMASPNTAWLLTRSLETLKIRMEKQAKNAKKVAKFLKNHPKVEKVYYLGFMKKEGSDIEKSIIKRQYKSSGAMISFDIKGGEKEAFTFLNSLNAIHLAVSLGSTESLAQHPATMTHADVDQEIKDHLNVTAKLVRLSIGVEHHKDLIADIAQALEKVK